LIERPGEVAGPFLSSGENFQVNRAMTLEGQSNPKMRELDLRIGGGSRTTSADRGQGDATVIGAANIKPE
jgi:hypothetical protein